MSMLPGGEQGMGGNTVRFTVDLMIGEGKLDAFEGTAQAMVAGSRKESGTPGTSGS